MTLTLFKSEISQQQLNIKSYRNYNSFDDEIFESVISEEIEENNTSRDFETFKATIIDPLDKHAL